MPVEERKLKPKASLLVGMQNSTILEATLGGSWAVSYKAKHTLTVWSKNQAPWYSPTRAENLCPPKTAHRCL